MKKRARKIGMINKQEKEMIVFEWESGNYYTKELLEEHHITHYTLKRIIEEVKGRR